MIFLPHTNTVILLDRTVVFFEGKALGTRLVLWYYHRAWVTCGRTIFAELRNKNNNLYLHICMTIIINSVAKGT